MAGYNLDVYLNRHLTMLEQEVHIAVANYRLAMGHILEGSGISLSNPFPLYYPGMPAYDAAKIRMEVK